MFGSSGRQVQAPAERLRENAEASRVGPLRTSPTRPGHVRPTVRWISATFSGRARTNAEMIQAVQSLTTEDAARDLVRRCVEGDRAAQTRLFREEVRRVHGLLYRVLGPNGPHEDLIQETFLRVFRSLPQFRGESQLTTWIGGIALNVAYGYLRSNPPPAVRLELVPDARVDE